MALLEEEEAQLPLERLFNTASAKVLDFLLINEGLQYRESEIAELAAVPERTLQRILQALLEEGVVKRRRKGGRTYYYEADLSSPRVSGLLSYINATVLSNLDAAIRKSSRRGPRAAPP